MRPTKNYIDEKGNYHNIENLTLTQIYDKGVEEGYRIARDEEQKKALRMSRMRSLGEQMK